MPRVRFSVLVLFAGVLSLVAIARGDPQDEYRGTPVAWARLRTDGLYWDRHALYDSLLIDFIRDHTTFNVDETPRTVSAASLDELCGCPLIFVANVRPLPPPQRHNLAEYLRRGGFIVMDVCLEPVVTPDLLKQVRLEEALLAPEFPNLHVMQLRPDHPIFSAYFDLTGRPRQQAYQNTPGWENDPGHTFEERIGGLAGIYDGQRMIGVLMPGDILGSEILEESADRKRQFRFVPGPLFGQLILADEINRTPPKTQAALLEAMQERRVAIAGITHALKA